MKLTYWYARCLNDGDCYSVRAKTKKECLAILNKNWPDGWEDAHAKPRKVTVEYRDNFDLMNVCMGEWSGHWE